MRLFDTHSHFSSGDPRDIGDTLKRAYAAGVRRIIAVGGSPALNETAAVASRIANGSAAMPSVSCAFGYDRDEAGKECPPVPDCPAVAWGEIGLDYHYSADTRDAQLELFESQLAQARSRGLPVVIHTREADGDTLSLLRANPVCGVIHCFTGTPSFAKALLDLGFYVSFSGVVTFRSAQCVRDSALIVPDDRILIETDSPYLAPEPVRGRKNEPANIAYTCGFLAKLRNVEAEEFAELTFSNAVSLFGEVK